MDVSSQALKRGETFFSANDGNMGSMPWDEIPWGTLAGVYSESAEFLLKQASNNPVPKADMLLPIVTLVRHAAECAMKDIISFGVRLGVELPDEVQRNLYTHHLGHLSKGVATVFEQLTEFSEMKSRWKPIRRLLEQWQHEDVNGSKTRFAQAGEIVPLEAGSMTLWSRDPLNVERPIKVGWAVVAVWKLCEHGLEELAIQREYPEP